MTITADTLLKLLPIGISLLALSVSCLSLGWNIYRDLALRARLRVTFGRATLHHSTFKEPRETLILETTNLGPGKITLGMIQLRTAPLWRRLLRCTKRAVMINDYENPLSGKLPATLEVGEKHNLLIPYKADCLLTEKHTHIGISDTFGRIHWARAEDLRKARKEFREDFGKSRGEQRVGG